MLCLAARAYLVPTVAVIILQYVGVRYSEPISILMQDICADDCTSVQDSSRVWPSGTDAAATSVSVRQNAMHARSHQNGECHA